MQLQVTGTPDPEVMERLETCNIRFNGEGSMVRAQVQFRTQGKSKLVDYSVIDGMGNYIVPRQTYSYTDARVAGVSLAYRLFGVGGTAPREETSEGDSI
jgi:hypothetical protein